MNLAISFHRAYVPLIPNRDFFTSIQFTYHCTHCKVKKREYAFSFVRINCLRCKRKCERKIRERFCVLSIHKSLGP